MTTMLLNWLFTACVPLKPISEETLLYSYPIPFATSIHCSSLSRFEGEVQDVRTYIIARAVGLEYFFPYSPIIKWCHLAN